MSKDYKLRRLKVVLAIPSPGIWHADFALSLLGLQHKFMTVPIPGYRDHELQYCSSKGSILTKMRREAVEFALSIKASHVLWLDTDHTFPPILLHRLLSHKKEVVAANCVVKRIPSSPTARQYVEGKAQGAPVFSDPDKHGLEKVWRVGTGIMLVDTCVYEKTGSKIFNMYWREEFQTDQGEDWSMCEAVQAAGFDIYVDHDVSRAVGHIGMFEFTHDYVGEIVKEAYDVDSSDPQAPVQAASPDAEPVAEQLQLSYNGHPGPERSDSGDVLRPAVAAQLEICDGAEGGAVLRRKDELGVGDESSRALLRTADG